MKFVQTDYSNKEEILKFPDHYVAIAVTVDDSGIDADDDGNKIVPAGTSVGGVDNPVLENEDEYVEEKNDDSAASGESNAAADAEGVLLNDVDVTHGPAGGAMLIHGFLASGKLPEEITEDAQDAMGDMIKIIE